MSAPNEEHLMADLYTSMTGAGHGHDEQPIGPPDQAVLNVGHEPDWFVTKPILTVPVFISILMVVSFIVTSTAFWYLTGKNATADAGANPIAKAKNDRSFDTRISSISSTDAKADVNQPRLEMLKVTDSKRDGKADPSYLRSVRFAEKGNSPEYRPEDLRAENFVDPITRQKILRDYSWVDKEKGIARIPVTVAMKLLIEKNSLPVQANQSVPAVGMSTKPKLSNGGNELPAKAAKEVPVKNSKVEPHDH